jgi:hypothetical protein
MMGQIFVAFSEYLNFKWKAVAIAIYLQFLSLLAKEVKNEKLTSLVPKGSLLLTKKPA